MIARRNAARAAEKDRRGNEYLIKTWREQGIALGLLDPDDVTETRPTDSNSHVADHVVPGAEQTVQHIVGDHPAHSISAGAVAAMARFEGHSSAHSIKVI